MKKMIKRGVYVLSTLTFIALYSISCNKDADQIGLGIQPPGDKLGLSVTDTIRVEAYSLREDSVRTDKLPTSLLGSFFDPVFGKTTASIFTEIGLSNILFDPGLDPQIDSIVLSLAYRSLYGDSATEQTFKVYRVTEEIRPDTAYFSNQKLAYDQAGLLGTVTTSPPLDSIMVDTVMMPPHLRIPLNTNNTLESIILQGLVNGHFENNDKLREFFKGIYITAETVNQPGSGAIMTFDLLNALTTLRVFYHNSDNEAKLYSFVVANATPRFNHYEHYDYEDANDDFKQQVLHGDTSLGDEIIYLQPMGGVRTHLRIPGLSELGRRMKEADSTISVNEAKITFNLFESSPDFAMPSRLVLAKLTDEKGSTTLLDDQREGEAYFGGFLNSGKESYSFRLNRYVQHRLLNPDAEDFGLALLIPGASSLTQRVMLKGGNAQPGRITLVVTYTTIK